MYNQGIQILIIGTLSTSLALDCNHCVGIDYHSRNGSRYETIPGYGKYCYTITISLLPFDTPQLLTLNLCVIDVGTLGEES